MYCVVLLQCLYCSYANCIACKLANYIAINFEVNIYCLTEPNSKIGKKHL